ncbi:MAG: helix-turn-helix domain-containing protein [Enterococcus sp.]
MEELFNKQDPIKIKLIYYLLTGPSRYREKSDIEKLFNLSSYSVETRIKELNAELVQVQVTKEKCKIIEIEKGYQVVGNIGDIVSRLLWFYGKKARSFILLDMIVQSKKFSMKKYSEKIFLEVSSTYKIKKELKTFLQLYQVDLKPKYQLSGEEHAVRQLLFSIYFTIFKTFEWPFPDYIHVEADQLFRQVVMDHQVELKEMAEGDKQKIFCFLGVIVIRMNRGAFLQENNPCFSPLQHSTRTVEFFQRKFKLSEAIASVEYQSIEQFLKLEQIIGSRSSTLNEGALEAVQAMADDFLRYLHRSKVGFKNKESAEQTNEGLLFVFEKVLLYSTQRIDSLFYLRKNQVSAHYPTQFQICKTFLENYFSKKEGCERTLIENHSLLLSLLSLLDEVLEYSHVHYEVKVRLDFSLGTDYQREILNLMNHKLNLPILLSSTKEDPVDILLTDRNEKTSDKKNIVTFSYPPTTSDWTNLSELILKVLFRQ